MWWWIAIAVLTLLILFWADRRQRRHGTRDSGGAADHPIGPYI